MKITTKDWESIRLAWESDPTCTFSHLATQYGVNRSTIYRHAEAEHWEKRGVIEDINEAAQRKADVLFANNSSIECNKVFLARSEAEDKRAEILLRHRKEWYELDKYRLTSLNKLDAAIKDGSRQAYLMARALSETIINHVRALLIKQEGERKAWGIEKRESVSGVVVNNNITPDFKIAWDGQFDNVSTSAANTNNH